LDGTENNSTQKDEDLNYCTETCQVYSHNVKGKCIKFPEKREHFGIFGGGLKLQYRSKVG